MAANEEILRRAHAQGVPRDFALAGPLAPGLDDREFHDVADTPPAEGPVEDFTPPDGAENEPAAYGFGLAKNHPFNDAKKRTAFIAMRLFLKLNGYDLSTPPEEKYRTIIQVAASDVSDVELAQWIRANLTKLQWRTSFNSSPIHFVVGADIDQDDVTVLDNQFKGDAIAHVN